MRRRELIVLLGGAAVVWPLAGHAQQPKAVRRIGVLTGGSGPDSASTPRGIPEGAGAIGLDRGPRCAARVRRCHGDADAIRKHAAELVALAPDVIVAIGGTATGGLLQATRTVPIVFTIVPDPVGSGSGFVDSLARPGGNATGFVAFEYSLTGKWLELLKEIVPGVTRAAVLRYFAVPAGIGQFVVIQSVAPSLGVEVTPISVRDPAEIERDVAAFARSGNSGLIVASSTNALVNLKLIVSLAARS